MATKTPKASANGHTNRIGEVLADAAPPAAKQLEIPAPKVVTLSVRIKGITPLLICSMSQKTRNELEDKAGGKKGPKNKIFDKMEEVNGARHVSTEGWDGIHAAAFRGAMIDACRLIDAKMSEMKQCIFIVADGYSESGEPLVRIQEPKAFEVHSGICRVANGATCIRHRPIYKNWSAVLTFQVFAGLLSPESAVNLLEYAGRFCGVGDWRPSSKFSKTGSFGTFAVDRATPIRAS